MSTVPALFLCEPLHARISVPACGARWRGANSADGPPDLRHSVCKDCPIGKGNVIHAAALRANPRQPPRTFPETHDRPKEDTVPKAPSFAPRQCKACEKDFTPSGPASRYCETCGAPSRRTKADEVARAVTAPPKPTALAKRPSRSIEPPPPRIVHDPLTSLDAVADAAARRRLVLHRDRVLAAFDLVLATMGGEGA